ncbi:hypothetical protein VPH35_027174 [Triticum aestivum]
MDISFGNYAHGSIDDLMPRGGIIVTDARLYESATLRVHADDFVVRHITFRNTHNAVDKSNMTQALAALVNGDRIAFYGCAFTGFRDTLCDKTGWVDFIYDYARSIYDGCTVVSNMPLYSQQPGWVTAHAGPPRRPWRFCVQGRPGPRNRKPVSRTRVEPVGSTGPGSDMVRRVPWEKHLSDAEVKKFMDMSFIDDGWLIQQPS